MTSPTPTTGNKMAVLMVAFSGLSSVDFFSKQDSKSARNCFVSTFVFPFLLIGCLWCLFALAPLKKKQAPETVVIFRYWWVGEFNIGHSHGWPPQKQLIISSLKWCESNMLKLCMKTISVGVCLLVYIHVPSFSKSQQDQNGQVVFYLLIYIYLPFQSPSKTRKVRLYSTFLFFLKSQQYQNGQVVF